ncbi:monooxygenase [Coemansia biformis]|uniref:Monooxygenase n=1 Tax=Coemansia biformis TaxID=1286918 RepID=A0A9W7YCT6_9FUNG|nr:monooxygenase [Coemansia biformis]
MTKREGAAITVDGTDGGSTRLVARRIGIIGAGPAGLAAARMFMDENTRARSAASSDAPSLPFQSVTVFDRNSSIGGVWNYTQEARCHYNVPQASPERAVAQGFDERCTVTGSLPTPMYDVLHANLTKDVMQFADFPFPSSAPDFPARRHVLEYIRDYADANVLVHEKQPEFSLHLDTEVVDLAYSVDEAQWMCKVRHLGDGSPPEMSEYFFDAILVCVGQCSHPFIPDIPGLGELSAQAPGRVIHAKEYRRAADFAGRSVLVIGGSASASDISRQLSYTASAVHVSTKEIHKDAVYFTPTIGNGCNPSTPFHLHPPIARFAEDMVVFEDGTSIATPEVIIFATGYLALYPFIRQVQPLPPFDPRPFSNLDGANDLYKHMVYAPNPLLAVISLPTKTVPFSLSEYQAMYLAQVYQGNIRLPPIAQMLDMWQEVLKKPHPYLLGMDQIPYRNAIVDEIAAAASKGLTRPPRFGHVPEYWADLGEYTLTRRLERFGY